MAGAARRDVDFSHTRRPQNIGVHPDNIGMQPPILFADKPFGSDRVERFHRLAEVLADLIAAEIYRRSDRRADILGF